MAGGVGKMYKGLDFQGNSVIGLADASVSTGAVTLGQMQAYVRGLQWKEAVKAATTANITLSGTQTIDTVALVANDRVLVKDQSTGSQNGIYLVQSGAWTRALDLPAGADARGVAVTVLGGSTNDDRVYTQNADPAVVGTDALTFVQLGGGGGTYVAGAGLSESPAGTFNVDPGSASATGLEISSDTVRIAAAAAGNGLTGGGGSALAVGAGTGVSVTGDAVAVDSSIIPRKFTNSATHSAGATVSLTHSLGHKDYVVSVKINATGEEISSGVDITCNDNSVDAVFSASQSANTIRLTVIG